MNGRHVRLKRTNATRAMGWVGLRGLVVAETEWGVCTVALAGAGVTILIHSLALEVLR